MRSAPRAPLRSAALKHTVLLLGILLGVFLFAAVGHAYYPQSPGQHPPFEAEVPVLGTDLTIQPLLSLMGERKTLVFYFLPTCPHCQHAAPALARLARKYQKELGFMAVASGRSRLPDVEQFKATHGLDIPFVQDFSGAFAQKNGVRGTPVFFLTDGKKAPPQIYTSFSDDMEPLLEVAIERFLGRSGLSILEPTRYYGSAVCADCHREETISWGATHHSVAMASLLRSGKELDKACVGCHVVALDQPGGYRDLQTTPHLGNVGCESCHGPAGGHNARIDPQEQARRQKLGTEQRYAATCAGCHDARHTISFSLARGLPIAGHHQNRTLSEVELMARRTALLNGEAERPLLAFPPGKVVGSSACASCHAGIHKGWTADRHGLAMKSLEKDGKHQDVSCVKCHATLKDETKPEDLASYEAGVGCESCHGPGEAHKKAGGGRGNLVALTESCPVCIIESICSSCHTREQDPDFDLEAALARIRAGHKAVAP